MSNNAASITAAPFNIVAIRMSWPGQSTKDTCLTNSNLPGQPGLEQGNESSRPDPPDTKQAGRGHLSQLHL